MKNIDLNLLHYLYNKLDGSMISSMIPDDGNLYYTTKKGVTKISNQIDYFIGKNNSDYNGFSKKVIEDGYTPIFEWCSRKQKIVLDYPYDKLVLIAIRHIYNGNYLLIDDIANYADKFGVEYLTPEIIKTTNIVELVEYTRSLIGLEGYVIMMPDGDRFKIKADDYCRIHKTLEGISFEKDVLKLICDNKIDDIIPNLTDDIAKIVKNFQNDIIKNITNKSYLITNDVLDICKKISSKKDFAMSIKDMENNIKPIYFAIFDKLHKDKDCNIFDFTIDYICNFIIKNCSTQGKVDKIRWLFNINWTDYYFNE